MARLRGIKDLRQAKALEKALNRSIVGITWQQLLVISNKIAIV
jgi:hypothetical protein